MKVIKKRLQKSIKKVLKKLDLDKDLIDLISKHSFITISKEFKFLPTINGLIPELQKDDLEKEINEDLNKDGKKFKKLYKKISSKKNTKYQNLFTLNEVSLLIKRQGDYMLLTGSSKDKNKLKFLKIDWLKIAFESKKGLPLSIEDFELIYPDLEYLERLGLNIIYEKGKAKAKVMIFPQQESFFSTDDIFARKVVIDGEIIDPNDFKHLVGNGNLLLYKDKLIQLDASFKDDLKKEDKLNFVEVVRESFTDVSKIDDQLKEFFESKTKFKEIEIPKMKLITLEKYQEEGVSWLVNNTLNGFGSILADDMGLGKTVQTIATIQYLKELKKEINVLVIVPTAVMLNWEYEINAFSTLTSSFYYGQNRTIENTDVVLTTYGTVTYDTLLKDYQWDLIVIDEAQKIKNHDTIISSKINLIPSKSKIALTGTPVENNLMDLWSIFNFIIPGYLGNKESFKGKYTGKDISDESISLLKKTINPFILRREKSILPLPKKYIKDFMIDLLPEQEVIYNKLVSDALVEIEALSSDENGKRLGIILSTITRLKQVCNHPGNLSAEFKDLESAKLNKLNKIVEKVREKKEKIIIFTQYVTMANILAENLENSLVFHGGLNIHERIDVLTEFKGNDKDILIISLKAGGAGLNIVEANHVIHYDLWFNPAVENQATDRAYRRGQKKDVFVYRFVSRGTFEERINDLINSKKDLFDKTINGSVMSHFSKMNNGQLRELFSFGKTV